MRQVNPDDLEQLARLLDGDDSLDSKLSGVLTRASTLGVSGELQRIDGLQSWVSETGPDLRRRAGLARLDEGDPTAGLRIAGFTDEEIAAFDGPVPVDALLMANSMAAEGDGEDGSVFERQHREKIDDYLMRIMAHGAAQLPGMEPHEQTMFNLMKLGNEWATFTVTAGVVVTQGYNLLNVTAINPWLRSIRPNAPQRFLSAPGTWLPGQLAGWFRSVPGVNRLLSVPGTTGVRGDLISRGYNWFRGLPMMRAAFGGVNANGVINFLVGNDRFAHRLGSNPAWSLAERQAATWGSRAAQSRLDFVARNAYQGLRGLGNTRLASVAGSVAGAARAGGFLRFMGVGGGVLATGFSVANLVAQGNPIDAFNEAEGVSGKAGYLADWAEVGFNASLTAAMVAPNPVTVGAAVVTGVVYGGLKVVEHWDTISNPDTYKNAWNSVKDGASSAVNAAGRAVDGAKNWVKSWF
ncbi:PE-PGRS family protein [Streptomyces harbinensis]|nr:PE-PGRS family protein [Streptomyces harbinensis]